jgi:hypothetical protein
MDFDQTLYIVIPSPAKLRRGFLGTKYKMYVPSLVKIHWKMLILECSQGCYMVKIRPCDIDFDLENQ